MALGTPAPLATFDVASASAPTNIAVVKYWGKDEARGGNTPINSSCSLTLDPADLRAETVMVASPELDRDELWLNGAPVDVAGASTHARRLRACLATMRARCARAPAGSRAATAAELAGWRVRVVSRNTFPTAAGLASSAAGYAALVRCAAALYGVAVDASLSGVARVGSGSACRSLDGGLVAWRKGAAPDASDSLADPLHAADHWPGLRVVVVVASADEKETPSTEGMRRSVATSPFLAHRAAAVAEPRVAELAAAFGARDFAAFGELCMRDSNSFHATCLDSYPPIFYLDALSRRAIRAVHAFNDAAGRVRCAYTFDAGPNAVVFCEDQDAADAFAALALALFGPRGGLDAFTNRPGELARAAREAPPSARLLAAAGGGERGGAKMMYLTRVGGGAASPLPAGARDALVDAATGAPRSAPPALWQATLGDQRKPPARLGAAAAAAAALAALALLARRRAP